MGEGHCYRIILLIEYYNNRKIMTNQEIIILAILLETERYGYEIDKIIESRGIRKWNNIALSSIYVVLNRLTAFGLVSSRRVEQGGRPSRKLFSITENGRIGLEAEIEESLAQNGGLTGKFDMALLVWPFLSSERRSAMVTGYLDRLRVKEADYQARLKGEMAWVSAASAERSLFIVRSEIEWLLSFAVRNGVKTETR